MTKSEQLMDFLKRQDTTAVVRDNTIQVWAMQLASLEEAKEFAGKIKYWAQLNNITTLVIDEYTESQREYWIQLGALYNLKENKNRYAFIWL